MSAVPGLPLDPRACYQALLARDSRFDGRFFVGVSSTSVYCRPVCTVKAPRARNCSFFASAAAAEADGFRPCLRCRPELAPGYAVIDAPAAIARRAASLIEDGALNEGGVDELARQIGIGERHLRRVFAAQFGVSPVGYAQTQRLLLAKRLLTDTALPVTEVAMASGFSSLRRFNDLFSTRYRMAPSRLRQGAGARATDLLRFELAYRPPLDWQALLDFLAARTIAGVEHVDEQGYRRTVRVRARGEEYSGWIAVRDRPGRATLEVDVDPALRRAVPQVLAGVKRLFDLDAHPLEIALGLGELASAAPGLRVPGAFDGFELAVRAILGQQVSVRAAHTIAGRVAARFGRRLESGVNGLELLFPDPATLAVADPVELAKLGIVMQRARAIVGLANALDQGRLILTPQADVGTQVEILCGLPGIGDWTAQYIAMRALAWPDAFPASDLVVMRALGVRTASQARAAAAGWSPWRAYAVMHLWVAQARARQTRS